ncbi:hypothetical protein PCASD_01334 [Puccinia coronata f. sp. avenae]|uniref:Uncharacterized protein n=1 Tax=Puccinia coronata f. sp. avenae TaxID=200324 RepID=A0A2N5VJ45_9BASI|nr:hypothetical protein PCASD_01334 [Puccinia coronata f. sp. avenae]
MFFCPESRHPHPQAGTRQQLGGTCQWVPPAIFNLTNTRLDDARPYKHIDLKAFLKVVYIPAKNELTQSHMIINDIDHWSYFKTATEGQLTQKGFPIGTVQLLYNAAAHIQPYQKEATMAPLPQVPCNKLPIAANTQQAKIDAFLSACRIPVQDQQTCSRMNIHRIHHWSFFLKSSEEELVRLGFGLETSVQICQGVAKLTGVDG